MSVRCIDAVLSRSQHAGSELLMLVVLADYSDDDGNSYPAVASLARKCRMSPRNANYIMAALQASGELRVLKNEGPKGTNRYRIMLAQLGVHPLQAASPLKSVAPLQRTSPLKGASPLKPASAPPEAGFLKPLKPTSDEPSLNRQEPSSPSPRKTRATKSKSEHPLFADFYAAYPRKVARPDAAKAFAALNPTADDVQAMLKAIKAQGMVQRCADGEERFVPHPATWLNKRRWEDQVTSTAGQTGSPSRTVLHADHVFGGAEA